MNWDLGPDFHDSNDWPAMEEPIGDSPTMDESDLDCVWKAIEDWQEKESQMSSASHKWRKCGLAINALNRMKLVVVSNHPVNKGKAPQTAIGSNSLLTQQLDGQHEEINSHSTEPTLDEESAQVQAPSSNQGWTVSDDEARRCIWNFLQNFCIVDESYVSDGKIRVSIESKGPIAIENIHQVANSLHALFEGSRDPESLNPRPVTVPSSNSDELDFRNGLAVGVNQDGQHGSQDEFHWSPSQSATAKPMPVPTWSPSQSATNELKTFPAWSPSQSVTTEPMMFPAWSPSQSVTADPMMFPMDNNPLTPESTRSAHPWDIPDLPAQIDSQSGDWNHSVQGLTGNLGYSGMESRQHRQKRLLDQPLQELQKDQPLKDLMTELSHEISEKFFAIDQASDRTKLENVKKDVQDQAVKLKANHGVLDSHLNRFFGELLRTVGNISKNLPDFREDLQRAIRMLIKHFKEKDFRHFAEETGRITKKLERITETLLKREVSAIKVFQNCASSIQLAVEQILARHSSNFITVTDFNNWYIKEACNLSNNRGLKAASL